MISDGDHVDMGSNDFSSMLYSNSVPITEIEQDKQQDEDQETMPAAKVVVNTKHINNYMLKQNSFG